MTNGLQPLAALCMDGRFAGQTGLMQLRLLLTQHLLAVVAERLPQCGEFHRSGRSSGPTATDIKLTFSCACMNLRDAGRSQLSP